MVPNKKHVSNEIAYFYYWVKPHHYEQAINYTRNVVKLDDLNRHKINPLNYLIKVLQLLQIEKVG